MHRSGGGGGYPRRVLIAVAAALIPMIAGCEAGTNAPSLHWHQPTDGTFQQDGDITISNAFVLGAPIGAVLPVGQNAGLYLGLFNAGKPDRLLQVSAPKFAQSVRIPGNQLVLNSQHVVLLTGPRPALVLEHLLRPLGGKYTVVQITLTFANAHSATLTVPVIPAANFYTTLSPPPSTTVPSTTGPSAKGTPTPSGKPTTASPSPSAS